MVFKAQEKDISVWHQRLWPETATAELGRLRSLGRPWAGNPTGRRGDWEVSQHPIPTMLPVVNGRGTFLSVIPNWTQTLPWTLRGQSSSGQGNAGVCAHFTSIVLRTQSIKETKGLSHYLSTLIIFSFSCKSADAEHHQSFSPSR